jgi:hypothetical protein
MSKFRPERSSDLRQVVMAVGKVSDCYIHFICGVFDDPVRISHSVASEIKMAVNDE